MTVLILSFLFSIAAIIFFSIAYSAINLGLVKYRQSFNKAAKINLSDLYLFIEPERIFILNVVFILVCSFFVFAVSGSVLLFFIAFLGSALAPRFLSLFLKRRRRKFFSDSLPDALGQISSALKAGLSFSQAVDGVIGVTSGPIQQELLLFSRELRLGIDVNDALDNMYERMPVSELNLAVSSIKISRETGGQLAENLERLSETLRKKIEMEGKIDALTSQGRAQGYVMTGLPVLLGFFIYQIEPEQMSLLWTTAYGWAVIAVILVLQLLGFFFIRKIVNIDV